MKIIVFFLMWNCKKRWWSAELIFRINEFIRYLFDLINIYYNLNDIYISNGIWIGKINDSRIWIVYFFCLYYNRCIRVELLIFKFILRFMTKWLHVYLSFYDTYVCLTFNRCKKKKKKKNVRNKLVIILYIK